MYYMTIAFLITAKGQAPPELSSFDGQLMPPPPRRALSNPIKEERTSLKWLRISAMYLSASRCSTSVRALRGYPWPAGLLLPL